METESRLQQVMDVVNQLTLVEQTLLLQRLKAQVDSRAGVIRPQDEARNVEAERALLSHAHEGKSGLMSIVAYARLLKGLKYGPLTDSQKEIAQRISQAGQLLQNRFDVIFDDLRRRQQERAQQVGEHDPAQPAQPAQAE